MSEQHTPGPWAAEDGKGFHVSYTVITAKHAGMTAETPLASISNIIGDATPDARLIAAAPELVEALQEVCRVIESNPSAITNTVWVTGNSPETLYDHCRAAIAKALGETT